MIFFICLNYIPTMDKSEKSGHLEPETSNSSHTLSQLTSGHLSASTREYDTSRWTSQSEDTDMSDLAFLPIIAIIILIVCSLLKAYQWSRARERWKARVGVELSEETEENPSSLGNRDFSPSDSHSEGGSLYNTVSSFRLLENGYAIQLNESHPYHDTVTSYKSLLMQKADGSQYDSVKSYKAFLQKVTQNKDLAVEVKLLENYPILSQSAEHCVVLEEESSGRSGEASTKMLGKPPLRKLLHKDGRLPPTEKKKSRQRKCSGEEVPAAGMRKRSATNPTYCRVNRQVGSLPSIRHTLSLSSDSDEDTQQSLRMDRQKLWAERRKISRSASGGNVCRDSNKTVVPNGHVSTGALHHNKNRHRHLSADGMRHHKKAALSSNGNCNNTTSNNADLNEAQKWTHSQVSIGGQVQESSSENPASSNSSDSDVLSDAVVSDSDDDTKRNTVTSTASDDHTFDNDVFFSIDSGAELLSSSEILQHSPQTPLSKTRILIAQAKEEFFNYRTLMPPAMGTSKAPVYDIVDHNPSDTWADVVSIPVGSVHISNQDTKPPTNIPSQLPCEPQSLAHRPTLDSGCALDQAGRVSGQDKAASDTVDEAKNLSSPHRVQRFHVTHVGSDMSSLNPE